MSLVRPVVRDDARALGLYPRKLEASITLRLTFSEADAPSVNVRETAEADTPAIFATSFKVTTTF